MTTAYANHLDALMDAIVKGDTSAAPTFLREKEGFAPPDQLGVYVEAYRLRLLDAVTGTYPALAYYMGNEKFNALALRYIEDCPSRCFNLDKYPVAFGAYVATQHNDPFALELARLESAIAEVYMSAESPAIARNWAAQQTMETLAKAKLAPRAASRLLAFTYPMHDYLTAFREGKNPGIPKAGAHYLLVYRHLHQVQRLALSQGEHALLMLLDGTRTLAEALESGAFAPFTAEALQNGMLMQWFAHWIDKGCLRQP